MFIQQILIDFYLNQAGDPKRIGPSSQRVQNLKWETGNKNKEFYIIIIGTKRDYLAQGGESA